MSPARSASRPTPRAPGGAVGGAGGGRGLVKGYVDGAAPRGGRLLDEPLTGESEVRIVGAVAGG